MMCLHLVEFRDFFVPLGDTNMREDQSDRIINLLGDLVEEMRGMRSDFMEFTGHNSTKMSDLSNQICGEPGYSISEMMGPLGYSLQDLHTVLGEIASSVSLIDINTQP